MLSKQAQAWILHQRARNVAGTLVEEFEAAGVSCLLFKGIVLAHELYADVAERPISDVDVLVRPRDFFRVVSIARRRGWRLIWDSKVLGVVNVQVQGICCDVSAFVGPAGTSALGVAALLAAAIRTQEGLGFTHRRPELHDHALLMAVDLFKDKFAWAKPHAREDLLRLGRCQGFRPDRLVERARQAGLGTMLAIVARWVLEAGPCAEWMQVRDLIRLSPSRERYAADYRALTKPRGASYPWRAALTARMVSDIGWRRAAAPLLGAVGVASYLASGRRLPKGAESSESSARTQTGPGRS